MHRRIRLVSALATATALAVLGTACEDRAGASLQDRPRPRSSQNGSVSAGLWVLTLLAVTTFMLVLDITVVLVALAEIQAGLHASLSGIQWVIDAYALTLAAFLLTAATLVAALTYLSLYVQNTLGLSPAERRAALPTVHPHRLRRRGRLSAAPMLAGSRSGC